MSQFAVSESPSLTDIAEGIAFPPGDLLSDKPPLETDLHRKQLEMLISSVEYWWQERQDFYVSGNLTVNWYSRQKNRNVNGQNMNVNVQNGPNRRMNAYGNSYKH